MKIQPVPELVPARMINEVLYCERLMYLEWSQGEFADNYYTADGSAVHRRVDEIGGELASAESSEAAVRPYQARSVWLSSATLGITAKIDTVESVAGGVVPVEYKRGKVPDVPENAHLPERAQVCAQVLLLREHGYRVDGAEVYFATARRRVSITIDDELITITKRAAVRARELCVIGELPPPLVDSSKCCGCSLVGICLPDETNLLRGEGVQVRRFAPARDDRESLHVQEQGARIGLRGDCLYVRGRDGGEEGDVRIVHTSGVSVYGNVQVSTQALRALFFSDIPVSFFTTGGWLCGRASGSGSKNIEVRVAQFRIFSDDAACLRLARGIVASKVKNCRTMLRRNGEVSQAALKRLDVAADDAQRALSLEALLGVEGVAARDYFGVFSSMLREESGFSLDGRNRRPPRDPVNALLSFAYALLARDFVNALAVCGLDPLYGFYHQPRFGRPSLALDLMEEFRPVVADSAVISVINTGEVGASDFVRLGDEVSLAPHARRAFIQAYERRMDQLVAHPVFGYRVSYRRVLEVQARLLTRVLLGEITEYPQFRVR